MMHVKEWDERYAASDLVWSAGPNQFVESICRGLPPGRMIDLAAGEGRNAVWFAEQGWDATAVDFSAVALAKAEDMAAERGVEITTIVADLLEFEPGIDAYDLVLIAYLQIGPEERALVLERATAAVAPGGRLLVVGHDVTNIEHGYGGPSDPGVLNSPDEIVAGLGEDFIVTRAEVADRVVTTDEGERVAKDTVVLAQRSGA
jgi:SAM-dependent methyltransferase